jgi:hypothetical protein
MSALGPLENVPIAVNGWVCPALIESALAVMATDCSTGSAGVTVNTKLPTAGPSAVAVIADDPALTPVATPELGSMVAIVRSDDSQ